MEIELLLRAAKLLEEGLVLWFPDGGGVPYAAPKPRQPEDVALILHPLAFSPYVADEDLACDEFGEPIFWSFVRLA